MKKRSSNFFTLIGVGKINFLEFTTKMRNTEDIIEDSMRLLNVSYNQKNITEALRDYEVIWYLIHLFCLFRVYCLLRFFFVQD